jgi:flagellar protein FlaG
LSNFCSIVLNNSACPADRDNKTGYAPAANMAGREGEIMEPLGEVKAAVIADQTAGPAAQEPTRPAPREQGAIVGRQSRPNKAGQVDRITTEKIADAIQQYVRSMDVKLKFHVHEGTGNMMVRVVNEETGELVREIPPEEILNLAAKIDEMIGTLFDVQT